MSEQWHQQARLRHEVAMLRERESRRVFDLTVNVGIVAGERDSFVLRAQDLPVVDAALRVEVASCLVAQSPREAVSAWVARAGEPHPHDRDLEWLSAATIAFGIHERRLVGFYAVTRSGWLDVRSGERRTWKRLRI